MALWISFILLCVSHQWMNISAARIRFPSSPTICLINFDDARAAAGFKVLAELGQKTQILFFTHHQHLVDIARTTLGKGVNVISLAE